MPTILMHASREPDGAVTTEQRVLLMRPVVEPTEEGACELGRAYWREVGRFMCGAVRVREGARGVELRLLGGPALLRFGPAELTVEPPDVSCRYPIRGGLLARLPSGSLTLRQSNGETVEVCSRVAGFHPRLAARSGFPDWTGALYTGGQARVHDAVGRRFLERLAREQAA